MPYHVQPPFMRADVSTAIEILGNRSRVEILGFLGGPGPNETYMRGSIVDATSLEPHIVGRHLVALEERGIVEVDQPLGDRRGTRPRYRINRDRMREMYLALGAYLGLVISRTSIDVDAIDEHLERLRALLQTNPTAGHRIKYPRDNA